ncbi:MAG: DUF3971 domain-containing protein, partial [Gammaproteobacteria bacterium]|nr:DUF3971 domain-containing protein [Gammaproteobacteria bacterium]
MSKLLGKILKWLTYVAAASIMMLALLVGVARLFLPLIQEYQEDIRLWASEVTGVEVRFESISASWPFAGPEIELIGVTVSAPGSGERIVALEKLSVGISLVRLLRDREALVDRLGISGAELRVERTDDGRILLQGLPPEQFWGGEAGAVSRPTIPDLRLKLADIEVAFSDATRSADIYQIGLSQLAIQLGDDNLDIEADINLPAEFGGRLQVSAGLPTLLLDTGPEETVPEKVNRRGTRKRLPAKWQAYFEGEELNLEPILSYWVERDFPISDAKGDMSLRATFEDRTPIKLSAELDIDTPVFRIGPEEVRQYEALKGRFEWEKLESGWQLAGSDLGILSRDLLSPDLFGDRSDFSLTYDQLADTNEQRLVFSTKFFRLQDFYPLIRVAESEGLLSGAVSADTPLPQAVYGDLLAINLSVLQTAGVFSDLAVAGEFKDFGVTGFAGGDSLTGFSGRVAGSDNRGVFELNTRNAELDLPSIFIQPLQMESLNGSFAFEIDTDWFRIVSGSARIGNSFAQLNVRLMLDWPRVSGQAPLIDLQASGQATNAPDVITALPLNKFSPAVSAWLQSSVLAGRVDQVGLQLQGPLNAFPFAEEQGIFRVDIDIAEGVFSYAPEWPRIDRLQGRLVLEGPGLYSVENSGVTGGVEFENADIKLLDFGEGLLEVRASQSVQVPAILNYLQLSPIAQAVGKVLEDATGSGSVMADFSLSLPVSKPDLFDLNIDLVAEDVALGLTGLDWGLARLAGEVSVRNTRFYANNLAGMLLDEPVRLDLWPAQPESSNQQFIKVSGRTPIERWMQTLSLPFAENISGATDWQALTVIPDSDLENERPVSIIVRSDLAGVTSDLPVPLGKAADAQDR